MESTIESLPRHILPRPRLLFAFCPHSPDHSPDVSPDRSPNVLFHSVYQEENPLLSSGQQQMLITLDRRYTMISAPIRGLVCLHSRTKVVLCNPGTKKLLKLPEFEPVQAYSGRICFLGYDEVTDTVKVLWSESAQSNGVMHMYNQVFTLGPGENSWRPIVCEHPYYPVTDGLCIRGVLYYGVWFRAVGLSEKEIKNRVMSFNVRSEEFTFTELPEGVELLYNSKLVNYNGQVALVTGPVKELDENGEFQICVRDESAGIWRVEHIVIPRWRDTAGDMLFGFEGTTVTGELIFAIHSLLDGSHFVLYYDPVTQNLRKFKIEGVDGGSYHHARTFLNHYDSLLLT